MYQIKINCEKNLATIDLNRFFYPLHLVHQAASKFQGIAAVLVQKNKARVLVEITPKGIESPESIALHFCNFVLALKRELGEHA